MTAKAAATPGRKASGMFREAESFSDFSVNDLQKAKEFYGQTLGLDIKEKHRKDSNCIQTTTRFFCIRNRTIPRHLSRFLISQ